jgi:GT2 family glycosyltransferase
MNISVIIPTLDNPDDVIEVVQSLNNQSFLPLEIVIADSSSNNEIHELTKSMDSKIDITYTRLGRAYKNDRLFILLKNLPIIKFFFSNIKPGRAYPYEASNRGSSIAKHDWLAFLDATTIPHEDWLKDYIQIINTQGVEVVFGKTKYFDGSYLPSELLIG